MMADKNTFRSDKDDLDTEMILSKLAVDQKPNKPDKVDLWGMTLVGLTVTFPVAFLAGFFLVNRYHPGWLSMFIVLLGAIMVALFLLVLFMLNRAQKEMMPVYLRQMDLERKALLDPHVKSLLKMLEKDLSTADFNLLEERSENYRRLRALLNDPEAIADETYIGKIKQYSEALMEDVKNIKKEAREELILD
jgi:hypothetical protein